MLKFALFGVISLALQTSGQYQSQPGYPSSNPQPDLYTKHLPACPTYCQPLPPYPSPNPAPYPAPYPATYQAPYPAPSPAPYLATYPATYISAYASPILPIPIAVLYNSRDDTRYNGRRNNEERDGYTPMDKSSQPPNQNNLPSKQPTSPPNNQPNTSPNQYPNQTPNKPPTQPPNEYPNQPTNDQTPADNNYDPSPSDSPSRSGRPRLSAMISRRPISVPGPASGLFSNIGAVAGNFADSFLK